MHFLLAFLVDIQHAVMKINRDVGIVLEDAHLALGFGTDAAGGDIGDAAVLELEPRIGDVGAVGQHACT